MNVCTGSDNPLLILNNLTWLLCCETAVNVPHLLIATTATNLSALIDD